MVIIMVMMLIYDVMYVMRWDEMIYVCVHVYVVVMMMMWLVLLVL